MKRFMMLLASGVAVLAMSGCGGSGGGSSSGGDVPVDDGFTTLFLVNEKGIGYPNISYKCDSMVDWDTTLTDGEFSFYIGEDCTFDFDGLNGTDPDDIYVDDYIYIVDNSDNGKNRIDYACEDFGVGTTYNDGLWDGSFDYYADDRCAFYL